MDIITVTLVNIIWILYSMSEGIREGFYTFNKNNKKISQFETKIIFDIQRFLALSLSSIILFYTMGLIAFLFIICQILAFRYFHRIIKESTIKKLEIKRVVEHDKPIVKKSLDKAKELVF